jgi:radical SAM protein with 4Fe4S-binding SPASM domain
MELIIKPTELCNFKCSFCSSTHITEDRAKDLLTHEQIFKFLKRFPNTETIIVNGGDPLMLEPDYYWRIIDWLDEHEYETTIALTTNLWPFYVKPKKWKDLFNHARVGVTTSFNYGEGRLKGDKSLFTAEDFWKCSDTMLEHCGYRPDFISVITDMNDWAAIKNVELALEMSDGLEPVKTLHDFSQTEKGGVECKLNYAMASGDQSRPYLLSKMYKTYVDVWKAGLTPWEFNTKQMVRRLTGNSSTSCPQNRKCDETIRAMNPNGDYYSCGSFADDWEKPIDFELEMTGKLQTPLQDSFELATMKKSCYTCPMFDICNGCRKTIRDHKRHNLVEAHCRLMKNNAPMILEANGRTDVEVTPYVDESND